MRDRLIELISKVQYMGGLEAKLADYLLANGVIVPPCKVGDVVFQVACERVYESTVKNVIYDTNGVAFDERAIGESIFLTREEAENALAERRNRNDKIRKMV